MNVLITKAQYLDCVDILQLQKLAYQKEARRYNDFTIPPLTQTLEEMQEEYRSTLFLKLVIGDRIIGSIKGRKDNHTCHIGRLMVHPEHRGKGHGKHLIRRLEQEFADDPDITRFELFTGELSHDNIGLYRNMGYSIFKREPFNKTGNIVYLEKNTQ